MHLVRQRATVVSVAFEGAPVMSVVRYEIDITAILLTSSDEPVITILVTLVRIGSVMLIMLMLVRHYIRLSLAARRDWYQMRTLFVCFYIA